MVTVKGKVIFEVFRKGWAQIPLVESSVGLIDVTVNKGASFVTMQGGKYYLMIDKPGRYNLSIEFLIKASRERENGPGSFNLSLIPAPISQFEFMMPETEVDIFVEPAIRVEVQKEANKTLAWAIMPNTNNLMVRWTKALPKEDIKQVQLEPKIYADVATYASIGEGMIRSQAQITYSILQAEVSNFRIALPEDVSLLDVNGGDLRDWKVSKEDNQQYLDVYLNFGIKGSYALQLTFERTIGEGSVVAEIPSVKALGVERENGFIGISAITSVELAANKLERVTPIDIKELPSTIWGSSANPILLAFKYLNHPYQITIDVTRHQELPVLIAAIDSANYVSLHTQEGKLLTQATYQVRNNVKQFLRLSLPQEATLWSTFVAGKPVKPAKDKEGNVLIPLEKSQLQGENLTGFPVEIVYLDKGSKMNFWGDLHFTLPKTDIPISEFYWSLYLPFDYYYSGFKGDVRPIEGSVQPGFLGRTLGVERRIQGQLKSAADTLTTQYEPYYLQSNVQTVQQEVKKADQQKGVLPIKINVPHQGQLLQFSKLLVTESESPWVSFRYLKVARQLAEVFRLLLGIIFFIFAVFLVKKILRKKTG